MRIHRIFGVVLASDFPFRNRLETGEPPRDLVFTCSVEAPRQVGAFASAVAELPAISRDEAPGYLCQVAGQDVVRFPGIADFYVGDELIACHLPDVRRQCMVEIQILGTILSFWLERRGIPTLHGAAVEVAGVAVAFLSSNHGGKTALAAAMMRSGYALLTDDVLPVEEADGVFLARPGYPQMRMWPDEADHFLDRWEDLEIVHPGYTKRRVPVAADRFHGVSRPLGCLYLPRLRHPEDPGSGVVITPLRPRDAVIELVRHSFALYLVETAGWQARRLGFFARLARRVPVCRLEVPRGFEHLPSVCEAITEDLERRRSMEEGE